MPHVRWIRPVVNAALLAVAALSLAACDVVINSMEGGRAKAEDVWTRSYTLSGPDARIDVSNVNGKIEVEATDGTAVEVKAVISARGGTEEDARASLKRVEIKEEVSATHVRLESKYPRELGRNGVSIQYTLRVPKSVRVGLDTVNGTIAIVGVRAGVKAETTNGNVEGRGLGNAVTASTTNGSIKVQMAEMGGDGVSLETTNGSIDLKLPEQAKATLSARCVNGGIGVSDLSFEKQGESTRRKLDGTINGGGAAVKLETVNGSIRVGRAG
ncbi:MAG: DUF4097 family beta strand repeat-containing protein [Acidobacteria bacterium]|nr:DUF4097 family beta strand repeat-containing protein [Acidobacteriota bacterium]